ncbi:hypothetical protein J3Q64DRAFT_1711094 [Phycomyces blakesleeanus]|uniref:Uncharacterized protein n=1 Tax=Phycomyces blakesleeanus TaxID=4837 RepID=A0ABR3BDX8_PHYBL
MRITLNAIFGCVWICRKYIFLSRKMGCCWLEHCFFLLILRVCVCVCMCVCLCVCVQVILTIYEYNYCCYIVLCNGDS